MPDDSEQVLSAIRLGWYVAEVRGRNRPDGPVPAGNILPSRGEGELPLRFERSPRELRIEAQATLEALAIKLKVDVSPANPKVDIREVDKKAQDLDRWRNA